MKYSKKAGFYTTLTFLATMSLGCETNKGQLEKEVSKCLIQNKGPIQKAAEGIAQGADLFYHMLNAGSKISIKHEIKRNSQGQVVYTLQGNPLFIGVKNDSLEDIARLFNKTPEEITKKGNTFTVEDEDLIQTYVNHKTYSTYRAVTKSEKLKKELMKLKEGTIEIKEGRIISLK